MVSHHWKKMGQLAGTIKEDMNRYLFTMHVKGDIKPGQLRLAINTSEGSNWRLETGRLNWKMWAALKNWFPIKGQ